MKQMINLKYLQTEGFKKDTTTPVGVNRWGKTDGKQTNGIHITNRTYSVSVTLSADGSKTEYGVINFYGDYGHIIQHRYFNGAISVENFKLFLDRNEMNLPKCVRKFPES